MANLQVGSDVLVLGALFDEHFQHVAGEDFLAGNGE